MKRTPNPHHTPCKEAFKAFYLERKNDAYYWTPKDAMHLNQLIKKIESKLVARSMEPTTEHIVNSLTQLLNSITDKWILDNLEVSIVNSKFNVIFAKASAASPLGIRDSVEEYLRYKNSQRAG